MFPSNIEYLAAGILFAIYVVLRLNVFPRISAHGNARKLLLALFCGVGLLNIHVYHNEGRNPLPNDIVSPTEKTLEELRKALPARGRVGFISDEAVTPSEFSRQRLFLTQYGVVPIVLEPGTDPELVIGSFNHFNPQSVPDDLILVRDFGQGIMLFRKALD